ncbi:Sulfhydryl oxidase [Trichostrongylus colubriformis]|uniref:Sulfhydryl oxidase n=1 Tax=Trichostrongylus colubriformis TaxID=6319 RepID=A0AAN8IKE7_TRICO
MLLYIFLLLLPLALCEVASYGTVPKGVNPTLYAPEDLVIQLDDNTFNDTIYCYDKKCTSYLVEDVRGWQDVVKIAAINCADSANQITCQSNNVQFFPFIKYFPRNSTDAFAGSKLRPYQSLSEMRDQLTKVVMDDYSVNRFSDWPRFDYLGDFVTWADLWEGTPASAQYTAIIFENHQASLTGAQLLLDLHKKRDRLLVRRCLKNHPLADALRLTDFPSLAIFKRADKKPILVVELRRLLLAELEGFLSSDPETTQSVQFHSRKNKTNPCDKDPEKCRSLYYVSEVDMLKAMRYALFRESSRSGMPLFGTNLTALHAFVSLLADHFPVTTTYGNNTLLDRSTRAVKVFARLRDFIENRGLDNSIPTDDWQKEFIAAEEAAGSPFAVNSDWDHCRGSSGQFRGYTCGLWIALHALTVSSYKQAEEHLGDFKPLEPLQAIRAWVTSFFGCLHCREHFLKMTTSTFPIEAQVHKPDDVILYLWKAHNIVNARLQGRDTEDPQFPKVQFPASFLCSNCTANGSFNEKPTRDFLINYYSQIKPYQSPKLLFR